MILKPAENSIIIIIFMKNIAASLAAAAAIKVSSKAKTTAEDEVISGTINVDGMAVDWSLDVDYGMEQYGGDDYYYGGDDYYYDDYYYDYDYGMDGNGTNSTVSNNLF